MILSTRNYLFLITDSDCCREELRCLCDTAFKITKQSDFLWASEFNSDLRKITFPPVLVFTLDSERINPHPLLL